MSLRRTRHALTSVLISVLVQQLSRRRAGANVVCAKAAKGPGGLSARMRGQRDHWTRKRNFQASHCRTHTCMLWLNAADPFQSSLLPGSIASWPHVLRNSALYRNGWTCTAHVTACRGASLPPLWFKLHVSLAREVCFDLSGMHHDNGTRALHAPQPNLGGRSAVRRPDTWRVLLYLQQVTVSILYT